jgi:LAO/AO transport system kinase
MASASSSTGRGRVVDVPALVEGVRAGQRSAVSRAITLVESSRTDHRAAARELLAALPAGGAVRVGISGVPGVGKSTFIEALGQHLTAAGHRVGVLAVDPSSVRTGGSVLGDKTRMAALSVDPDAYIRPSPTAGTLGGVARATAQAMHVLEAAGFDVVLVETVGVGQSEVEVAGLADTTVVLLAPGMGDGIQAAKAGILEIGDVFVVNKADREGADQTRREHRSMIAQSSRGAEGRDGSWKPPIVSTEARAGTGFDQLATALAEHRAWLESSGELEQRRTRRARDEIEAIALTALRTRWGQLHGNHDLDALAASVASGESDPYAAADRLLGSLD